MRWLCIGALWVWAMGAAAQDAATIARVEATFGEWLSDFEAGNGTIAITYRGKLVHEAGIGIPADSVVEIASLSKAITAVCVAELVNEGLLNWDDTLEQHLRASYRRMNSKAGALTVSQIITHSGGIGPDSMQRVIPRWLNQTEPRHWDIARQAVRRRLRENNVGKFDYNNENYAILGQVISVVTDEPYREACQRRVVPASRYPSAAISSRFGAYDSLGGWVMSAADYARFHARHFGAGSTIATLPRAFPHTEVSANVYYGPGMIWREFSGGRNFWHFGALCYVSLGAGAYTVSWKGEWGVVATWSTCQNPEAMSRLDRTLSTAVFIR